MGLAWPDLGQVRPEDEQEEVEETLQKDHVGGGAGVRPDPARPPPRRGDKQSRNTSEAEWATPASTQAGNLTFISFSCLWPSWERQQTWEGGGDRPSA